MLRFADEGNNYKSTSLKHQSQKKAGIFKLPAFSLFCNMIIIIIKVIVEELDHNMNLINRWTQLFGTHSLTKFDNLLSSYSKNFYHSLTFHIVNCLIELDKYYGSRVSSNVEKCYIEKQNVEIALWFHDAKSTELKSFEYLVKLMGSKYDNDLVRQLILATNHQQLSENSYFTCAIICDIDLSIFGQNSKVFELYEQLIRVEYRHIPDKYYKPGRIKILNQFLSRKNIYYTDYFRQRYEKKARENLSFSLKCLK